MIGIQALGTPASSPDKADATPAPSANAASNASAQAAMATAVHRQ